MKKLLLFVFIALFAMPSLLAQVGINIYDYHFNSVPKMDPKDDSLYKDDGCYYLFHNRVYDNQLGERGLVCNECNHYMVKILTEEMADKIKFDNFADTTIIIDYNARVIHPNGTTTFYTKDSIKLVTELNDEGKEDSSYKADFGIKAGDILEYYLVVSSDAFISGNSQISSLYAIKEFNYTLIYPSHLKLDVKLYNSNAKIIDTVASYIGYGNNEETEARYIYVQHKDLKPFREEPQSMRRRYAPRIEFAIAFNLAQGRTRLTSTNQFARNLYEAINDIEKGDIKAAKAIAKEIAIGKDMTTEQKIRAIENNIKKQYYALNINHEIFSKISTIKGMNVGNELAFLRLYNQLFKIFKIENNLVATTDISNKEFDKKFEGDNFMQEFMFYFPELDMYLYPMTIFRMGLTPSDFTNNEAAFMEELSMGKATTYVPNYKKIKPLPYTATFDSLNVELNINASEKQIQGSETRTIGGYRAAGIQANMSDFEIEQEEYFIEQYLGFGNENINVTGEKYTNNKPEDIAINPLRLSARFSTSDCATYSSKQIDLTIGAFIGKQSKLDWKHERLLPVDISYGHYDARTIVLNIPEGYTLSDNYKKLDRAIYDTDNESTAQAAFIVKTEVKDGKLYIYCTEYYKQLHYEVSEYPSILKVWNAACDFNDVKIALIKD
ncbi:MAG: hypothetical protein MJZ57_05850 [Bacteroidales bacterium]|nr:hypothetical protein [Bacteroidales bacterium]